MDPPICSNCNDPKGQWSTDYARGEHCCRACGMVRDDRLLDEHLERRNFESATVDHNRGMAIDAYFHLKNSTTFIGDAQSGTRSKLQRANQMLRGNDMNARDRRMERYFKQLNELVTLLQVDRSVHEEAKSILQQFVAKDTRTRRDPAHMAMATLFRALARRNQSRSMLELCGLANLDERDVWNAWKVIGAAIPHFRTCGTANEMIYQYVSELPDAPYVAGSLAVSLRERCEGVFNSARPSTVAAACLWMACSMLEIPVTQEDVATLAQIESGTVSTHVRNIRKALLPGGRSGRKTIKDHELLSPCEMDPYLAELQRQQKDKRRKTDVK